MLTLKADVIIKPKGSYTVQLYSPHLKRPDHQILEISIPASGIRIPCFTLLNKVKVSPCNDTVSYRTLSHGCMKLGCSVRQLGRYFHQHTVFTTLSYACCRSKFMEILFVGVTYCIYFILRKSRYFARVCL
jgi:hypothetical protein